MFKDKKPLIVGGALLGVLLIAGGGFFFWRQRNSTAVPEEETQMERREPLVVPPSAEEMTYETFTTADGNLSFEYPATWISTDINESLETFLPKDFIDKRELSIPLFLTDPRGAQLTLSVYRFEKGLDLNAVMDALEADLVSLGQPYNKVSRETVGETLLVDSTVDVQGVPVQIRDVLFLAPNEPKNIVYNLSFSARQENWSNYETIFSHIQSSAQLFP